MKDLLIKISAMGLGVGIIIFIVLFSSSENTEGVSTVTIEQEEAVESGIHVATGLIASNDYQLVIANCTSCHSAKLITQNRLTKNQWNATIKWMQETQNLWDLGSNHDKIVDYLVLNYPVKKGSRRANLVAGAWYNFEE